MPRPVLAAALVAVALVLQVCLVNQLALPGGVVPDLVLLTIVAIALGSGSVLGMVTGFCGGLAVDVVPPADHAIGRYAFVYCLIGYFAGALRSEADASPVMPFVVVAAGAAAGDLGYAGLGMMLGDPRASLPAVLHVVPLQALYCVICSPFVVWGVQRLLRLAGSPAGARSSGAALARARPLPRYYAGRR